MTDETVVNGAQLFYSQQFGIGGTDSRSTWLLGLVNSAPYLCCAFIGCWLTIPFNNWFGRRGTIFLTCFFSALACFWQAFTNTWWHMFIARFFLGFGIGPKSATVPIYAAEASPPSIRGALVMQWQMWTAFGIMVGYAADLAFYGVKDQSSITGLNWRLMMASAMLPAVIVCCFVFLCPESPRWYISKGRHSKAWHSIQKLRYNKVQAARDLFYIQFLIKAEEEATIAGQSKVREMVSVPRNRRAMIASEIVMFMQQFCKSKTLHFKNISSRANYTESGGVNVIGASLFH
jgi:MFS family permease